MMRKTNIFFGLLLIAICLTAFVRLAIDAGARETVDSRFGNDGGKLICAAYVTSDTKEMPDPDLVTHIYYAFAEINPDFRSADVINPGRLREIVDLKKRKPELKVILSIGGYRKAGFSEMCSSSGSRRAFVRNLENIVRDYDLDGIDLDWEFPTTTAGGHTARPSDTGNYVKFVKELRKALGKDKQISYYSNNSGKWIDHKSMAPYIDYVMVSGYNISMPPAHQSNLYNSGLFGGWSVDKAVRRHKELGVPYSKMLLGIPFYARTTEMHYKSGFPFTYLDRTFFPEYLSGFTYGYDDEAEAAYLTDEESNVVATFDTPESVAAKAGYVRDNGLSGGFYWHYCSEDSTHVMARAMHEHFMKKGGKR